ncbi:hypothetical protein [Aestuariimicrobium ganziense]|uniref:hypothetical protein n=1 Tax=Aestuariimicrobium ganziense TaxID=2773677 RepID=UPI0019439584|nr:hypothetical protein [Aestuariimicrobium ganziense]
MADPQRPTSWRAWLVRIALLLAAVLAGLVAAAAFARATTEVYNLNPDGVAGGFTVRNDSMIAWGAAAAISSLAYLVAAVAAMARRLPSRSLWPLLGIGLVVLAAAKAVQDFQPPVG